MPTTIAETAAARRAARGKTAAPPAADDRDMARTWRRLTPSQRLCLMNDTLPPDRHVPQSHFVTSARALARLGLDPRKSAAGRSLAEWAWAHGYATQDGPPVRDAYGSRMVLTWTFTDPPRTHAARPVGRGFAIDPDQLAALVAEGLYAAEIARRLGVSREGVAQAAKRLGLTLPRKRARPPRPPRELRPHKIVIFVSETDRAAIAAAAARAGERVPVYVRGVLASAARPPLVSEAT